MGQALTRHSIPALLQKAALKTEIFNLLWWQNWTSWDKTVFRPDLSQFEGLFIFDTEET